MSRTATLKKLLGDDWSLEFVDADGDCFFACVSKAFDGDPTTQELRDVVADACDDETLESFRAARAARNDSNVSSSHASATVSRRSCVDGSPPKALDTQAKKQSPSASTNSSDQSSPSSFLSVAVTHLAFLWHSKRRQRECWIAHVLQRL